MTPKEKLITLKFQAELALAAKDMVVQLQDIAEDLAKMQVENLMPLVDRIKEEYENIIRSLNL